MNKNFFKNFLLRGKKEFFFVGEGLTPPKNTYGTTLAGDEVEVNK